MNLSEKIDAATHAVAEVLKDAGPSLLAEAQDELKATWKDELTDEEREDVEAVALDLAELLGRAVLGEDVEHELAHATAAALSWAWTGADRVLQRWVAWIEAVLERIGTVALAAAKRALLG